jgi:hypothetical protein
MSFTPMKLKPESGANRIRSADHAYSFMARLRLSYQSNLIGRQRDKRSTTFTHQT